MSDMLRVTGMYSGIDTESIIQQLVQVKEKKVTTLKNEQKKLEWKQDAWKEMNSKIYNLYSKTLSNLRMEGNYHKKSTVCSDTTKATVLAGGAAANGVHSLKINQVAKTGYLTGAELAPNDKGEDWKSTDKLVDFNSELVGQKITVTVGSGDDAKTTEIEITEEMTFKQLAEKMSDAGVQANFDVENQRFFVSAKDSGTANDFTLTSTSLSSGESVVSLFGLDPTTNSGATRVDSQDAEIVLNGAVFTSSKNTMTINGLTITAIAASTEELSITTTTDYDGVYDTIKNFLKEYNELMSEMYDKYHADSADDYDILTDEQKESMSEEEIEKWESTIKDSLLRKDSSLYGVMNVMTTIMAKGYDVDGEKVYLFDFGIKKGDFFKCEANERNNYHIDGDPDDDTVAEQEDKLKKAIAEDPEKVAKFFSSMCRDLYDSIYDKMGTTDHSSIYKVYNDKKLQKEYDDYSTKIKKAEQELSDYEDRWYDKFTAMEVAMAKLQSNASAITGMLGGMGGQ